jgi:hypothetical protein
MLVYIVLVVRGDGMRGFPLSVEHAAKPGYAEQLHKEIPLTVD